MKKSDGFHFGIIGFIDVALGELQFLRLRIIHPERLHGNALHYLIFQGSVLIIRCCLSNFIHVFYPFDHLSKRRISAIQMRACLVHDEEVWKPESP